MKLDFPDKFYWGSSTSAHQVEGGNYNDWTEWENEKAEELAKKAKKKWPAWQVKQFPEMFTPENYVSGRACDHYNRYEKDFDIAKSLSQNAHRFSIEWSRIEPEEGKFDKVAIAHYRKVLKALKKRKIEPFVTLWHWTLPVWLAKQGGITSPKFSFYFSRYAELIVKNFNKEVKFWITINEPEVVNFSAYLMGVWPPGQKNPLAYLKAENNLANAHIRAYKKIHQIDAKCSIGMAINLKFIEPRYRFCVFDQLVSKIYKYYSNQHFFKLIKNKFDFIGLNYYFHDRIRFYKGKNNENKDITDLGWEIYPQGIYYVLKDLQKYDKPIYITENGLADAKDKKRDKYIKDLLFWVYKAIVENVDVRGYFYWSLLDNFEWDKGFWPRFGLVRVNFKTLKRTIRRSALEYAKICRSNSFEYKN